MQNFDQTNFCWQKQHFAYRYYPFLCDRAIWLIFVTTSQVINCTVNLLNMIILTLLVKSVYLLIYEFRK